MQPDRISTGMHVPDRMSVALVFPNLALPCACLLQLTFGSPAPACSSQRQAHQPHDEPKIKLTDTPPPMSPPKPDAEGKKS